MAMICRSLLRIVSVLTLLAFGLAGCSATSGMPSAPTLAPGAAGVTSYQIGAGDRLKITVFQHPDMSGEFALDGAGNLAMPLAGEIKANGLTTRELEDSLVKLLTESQLLNKPQVAVEVLNYRPFYILGEVRTPGSYPYVNGMTVLTAVALAGGFTYRANQSDFLLQRGGSQTTNYAAKGETGVLPGDTIT